ncbi:type III-A CRISPR-associated protein Cas10/Csm1 [Enterococcus sp. AZ109]|uniref:type III-A CRISPR-associated protein Cas10/Csm1 n=1 Tax=Enterococcus sp. AZ109 TaxID=2774634 RepID=UPI003F28D85F
MDEKLELMYGSLLHDIGKIIYRSNSNEFVMDTHSKLGWEYLSHYKEFQRKGIEESVRFHHYKELCRAPISNDSLAYITYVADNIANGLERMEDLEEGDKSQDEGNHHPFNRTAPLSSIFNIVNSENLGIATGSYSFGMGEIVKYPSETEKSYSRENYAKIKAAMDHDLRTKLKVSTDDFSSLLQWVESLWSYLPSSTNVKQLVDISLHDHSKLTCAIASCIYDYLKEKNIRDFKQELFSSEDRRKAFYDEEAFLLMSMDMSGIQDFIYNISGSQALKSLRARSFYLEMMLEVVVDDLLDRLNLTRANLLYTGGGHAYLLLPNTKTGKDKVAAFEKELRGWFLKMFTVDLSMSMAYQVCSGNDLMNTNGNYKQIWQGVSQKLSEKKVNKYDAKDIIQLCNNTHAQGERECKECLRSDLKINKNDLCSICESLIFISNDLRDKSFFVVGREGNVSLPFGERLSVVSKEQAERLLTTGNKLRIYSKNHPFTGKNISTNLWMCDYDLASTDLETKDLGIASYADREMGIQRLGVLRADIDNLGRTFMNGIPENYNSLARTTSLSRNLSVFFKYELNNILEGSKITVIYSGGDDLFLIGAWDDVIIKGLEIRRKFEEFVLGKLTFSAGIALFPPQYPVSKMAFEAGLLEDAAKQGEKNQVALWTKEKTYSWEILAEKILAEKLTVIRNAFKRNSEKGKSFIYKILELLRNDDQINIARLAYLLARSKMSDRFSQQIFHWTQIPEEKEQLITALEYYIYEIREG